MDCYKEGVRILLPLLSALVLSGCCVLDDTCKVEVEQPPERQPPNPVTTPGCSAEIDVQGAVVCAECDFAPDAICGVPNDALCEVRENSFGDACQLCVTSDGVILYDDCFSGAREASFCEQSAGPNEAESCTVCFDDQGNAVSTTCGPKADECSDVVGPDGRPCTRCTANGRVVSNVCESVDIDPSQCRAYGNEFGSCVDCFDDNNALLSHACTPAGDPTTLVCQQTVQPGGFVCTVCVDENGTPVDRFCEEEVVQPEHCGQLVFTEQTCIVCLDDANVATFIDCQRNDCAVDAAAACRQDADCGVDQVCFDGACVAQNSGAPNDPNQPAPPPPANGCEPAPPCTMDVGDDGAVCRTCPVTSADGITSTETRCISTGLACEVVPNDSFAPAEDPRSSGCVICRDVGSGVEVYRDCSDGSVPPPYCLNDDAGGGTQCSVCFDAVTDEPIYTSCDNETCFALESRVLLDLQQAPLLIDGVPATAACKQCGVTTVAGADVAALEAFSATCSVENVCQDPFGTEFANCPTTTTTIAVHACENPWDRWVTDNSDVGILQGILAFALERRLTLAAASIVEASTGRDNGGTCAGCNCETGTRIELRHGDPAAVEVVFDGFVVSP